MASKSTSCDESETKTLNNEKNGYIKYKFFMDYEFTNSDAVKQEGESSSNLVLIEFGIWRENKDIKSKLIFSL